MDGVTGRRPVPADGLLHPIPLLAIGLLVLNDHVLKQAMGGPVTGKMSDFAGLIFFPLFLQAAWEIGSAVVGRPSLGSRRVLIVAVVLTVVVFAAIKLMPDAADLYRGGLGYLQWLVGLLPTVMAGVPTGQPSRVELTSDPTDLIALPALAIPYLVCRARSRAVADSTSAASPTRLEAQAV